MMICQYCRTENSDDDHRCQRCGRRLQAGQAVAMPQPPAQPMPYSRSAAAHALAPIARETHPTEGDPGEGRRDAVPERPSLQYQRTLFSNRDLPQVVQLEIPSALPSRRAPQAEPDKQRTRVRRTVAVPGQQKLDFPAHSTRPSSTPGPGSLIDCDALTASLSSRISAFAFDATMILAASAIFLGVVRFGIRTFEFDRFGMAVIAGAVVLIAALYKTLWCLGNGDSPGLHWAKLRLVNFDGRRPRRSQRFQRIASGALSCAAMGLGLLWALVDEEALTWHDHICKCFPTSD